ncbi:uncharacterized protein [Prorops nasuta]|uniref:uncharacterized protein isoform X2 n=1 Tax=Prorops nasuta TaxID=863751 RepID=UPI0034CEF22C
MESLTRLCLLDRRDARLHRIAVNFSRIERRAIGSMNDFIECAIWEVATLATAAAVYIYIYMCVCNKVFLLRGWSFDLAHFVDHHRPCDVIGAAWFPNHRNYRLENDRIKPVKSLKIPRREKEGEEGRRRVLHSASISRTLEQRPIIRS